MTGEVKSVNGHLQSGDSARKTRDLDEAQKKVEAYELGIFSEEYHENNRKEVFSCEYPDGRTWTRTQAWVDGGRYCKIEITEGDDTSFVKEIFSDDYGTTERITNYHNLYGKPTPYNTTIDIQNKNGITKVMDLDGPLSDRVIGGAKEAVNFFTRTLGFG